MKKFILFCGLMIALTYGLQEFNKPATVAPHVKQYIQETSESFVAEGLACLEYVELGDHLVIYDYNIPQHYKQKNNMVSSTGCERGEMPIHNHPSYYKPKNLSDYYFDATGDSLTYKWQMLYMSGPDIRSSAKAYPKYVAVSANGSLAWWTRSQYRRAFLLQKILLKPYLEQTLWFPYDARTALK